MNFIGIYYIDDSICDTLIDEFNNSEKHQGTVALPGIDGNLSAEKISLECRLNENTAAYCDYIDALQSCLNSYIQTYPYCNYYAPFSIVENIKMQKYSKDSGYVSFHTERGSAEYPNSARHLVFMTYLNTIEEGGGTEFYHQNFISNATKGKTLIWPADWTHTHRGIPAPLDEKIIVTGWYNFIR